jgi:hypothetical protein
MRINLPARTNRWPSNRNQNSFAPRGHGDAVLSRGLSGGSDDRHNDGDCSAGKSSTSIEALSVTCKSRIPDRREEKLSLDGVKDDRQPGGLLYAGTVASAEREHHGVR